MCVCAGGGGALGNWATAVQFRNDYLPHGTHPTLAMVQVSSRLHAWNMGVPPPDECIYAIMHLHMICIYIRHTHIALIQRMRKHITTAMACSEDCHLQQLLRATHIEDWFVAPLQSPPPPV